MNKIKRLSEYEKGQIEILKSQGISNRKIAAYLNRNSRSIDNYFKKKENPIPNKRPGPKKKLNPREESRILREVSKNGTSIKKIKADFNLNVSRETIRRVIKNSPYIDYVKFDRKPVLNKINKQKRLEFARIHQTWNEEWKYVVLSDEKVWKLDGPDSIKYQKHLNAHLVPI